MGLKRKLKYRLSHWVDERKETLQRFSTSCPSLAEQEILKTPANIITNESGQFKSMLDLGSEQGRRPSSPSIMPEVDSSSPYPRNTVDAEVRICINDVTVDSTDDFSQDSGQENELTIGYLKKQQKRRSSWCPEEGKKREEKREKQRMLGVSGRSQSLSSLDGQDDEDSDEEEEEDTDSSYTEQSEQHSPSSPGSRGHLSACPDVQNRSSSCPSVSISFTSGDYRDPLYHSVSSGSKLSVTPPPVYLSSSDGTGTTTVDGDTGMAPSKALCPADGCSMAGPMLAIPSPSLMKSISTPAIPSIQQKGSEHHHHHSDVTPEGPDGTLPSNFEEGDFERPKSDNKEEKKRRSSVFSKLGSYRQKKLVKDSKVKSIHQFVPVSFSNSTACDVCNKSMANKAALQCENCMVNVHENSCKDQISQCSKFRHSKIQRRDSAKEKLTKFQSSSLPGGSTTTLKSSNSFNRAASVPARPLTNTQSPAYVQRQTSPSGQCGSQSSMTGTGYFQWRRVATKLGIDKVLNEERDNDKEPPKEGDTLQISTVSDGTNISDTMSVSMESLDEGTAEVHDFEDEDELMLKGLDAEAWSVTVDKKTLKKMSAKDIKRQDHIWELLVTEKSHCSTLKLMQKVFGRGVLNEVHLGNKILDQMFPRLDDLIDIHMTFLHRLVDQQKLRQDRSIEDVGDLLVSQFEGEMGERMKYAYGEFCSRHNEAVQLYKDLLKQDRKFQGFIKNCSRNSLCKRLSIPECILLVTQRITKYPLLIEPIIKTTRENKPDKELLVQAVNLSREILSYVDSQVDARAKEMRLIEIFNKLDARSSAAYRGKKFKKSDLLSNNRKLVHEGTIKWMSARGRAFEVITVILSDLMFFLSENNQKYTFFSQDNKSSVISLNKLLVREKGDTRDSKGIYLICQSKTEAEMYELVCRSADDRKHWIQTVREAIIKCPEEDEGVPSESEEERKLMEARSAKLRHLIDQLHQKDQMTRKCCDEKMKVIQEMLEIYNNENITTLMRYKEKDGMELPDAGELLQAALQEASRLMILMHSGSTNLCRSVSSVGEHESGTYQTPPLPKRAETFSGFESKDKDKVPVKKRHQSGTPEDLAYDPSQVSPPPHPPDQPVMLQGQQSPPILGQKEGSDNESFLSAEHPVNAKERMSRRMSTSFLQNLLTKQHQEKDEPTTESRGSSEKGSLGELSNSSSVSLQPLIPPNHEQRASLYQLQQYIHAMASIYTQQTTDLESLRAQLLEANHKLSRLYAESDKLDRKNLYQHDKQLEELRNLQSQINKERESWDLKRLKQEDNLDGQRLQLQAEQDELTNQKTELRSQREELQRQKEALQRQWDLFEQHKAQFSRASEGRPSPGEPGRHSNSPGQVSRNASSCSTPQSSHSDVAVVHKRSSSEDLQSHNHMEVFEPLRPSQTNSLKEPLNILPESSKSLSSRPVPMHLISATNEQKVGQLTAQKLPFKLASQSSGMSAGSSKSQSKLPFKLASEKSSTLPASSSGSSLFSSFSSKSSGDREAGASGSSLSHSGSFLSSGGPSSSRLMPSQPHSILPMKLAESGKRAKSTSPSPQSGRSASALAAASSPDVSSQHSPSQPSIAQTNPPEQPQVQKDTQIIYF